MYFRVMNVILLTPGEICGQASEGVGNLLVNFHSIQEDLLVKTPKMLKTLSEQWFFWNRDEGGSRAHVVWILESPGRWIIRKIILIFVIYASLGEGCGDS